MKRVVITGAGTINPLGNNVADTWKAMEKGVSAITGLDIRDADRLQIRIGAPVSGFDPGEHFHSSQLSMLDRATQFALVAADQAIRHSGLSQSDFGASSGVVMGTAGGGLTTADDAYRAVYEAGKPRVHPFTVPRLMHNAAASHVSIQHGITGPAYSVSTACAASNHAIAQAAGMIRSGQCNVMIAGGADAMLSFGGIKAWEALRVMSATGCRPFAATRDGMVMGEGAGVFVLEERERALGRGAPILAEICGFSMNADAVDMVAPNRERAAQLMQLALDDAGISPGDVGYINAHGTGTKRNDSTESAAIRQIFGDPGPLVSSTKSMHGHLMGATGAVELLACILALQNGTIAPNAFDGDQANDCPINLVRQTVTGQKIEFALSNAFAFGGLNAALVLSR